MKARTVRVAFEDSVRVSAKAACLRVLGRHQRASENDRHAETGKSMEHRRFSLPAGMPRRFPVLSNGQRKTASRTDA
jgi:hypothetical protein